jgi:predicted flap endonuclease-1-like 5' DNA nuclease
MTSPILPAARLGAAALLVALATACGGDAGNAADSTAGTSATAAPAMSASDTTATGSAAPAGAASTAGMLDPDAATRDQLLAIPGVTAPVADALVGGRPYANMLAVDRVLTTAGLAEAARDTVYTRLWKPIDLNKAGKDEILLIPGVGPRMQHEFEEYRPYRDIARFRREIGKYVDSTEVARLERYVTIR